jgi:hypothetical protein
LSKISKTVSRERRRCPVRAKEREREIQRERERDTEREREREREREIERKKEIKKRERELHYIQSECSQQHVRGVVIKISKKETKNK